MKVKRMVKLQAELARLARVRRQKLLHEAEGGKSLTAIAREAGISHQRVSAMLKRARAERDEAHTQEEGT